MQENRANVQLEAADVDDDEIDLRLLLKGLWRYRKLIFVGTFLIVVLALAVNEYAAKYRSEGFFAVVGITPINYKRYQPVILNPERFRAYAAETGMTDDAVVRYMADLFSGKSDGFSKAASLVSPLTPKDVKEFVLSPDKISEKISEKISDKSAFLGLQMDVASRDPVRSKDINASITQYFVDSIMWADLSDWIESKSWEHETQLAILKNQTILTTRSIAESEKKLVALRDVVKRIPEAATMQLRQVMAVENGAEKYMSPVAQMVAEETNILNSRIALQVTQRQQKQLDLMNAYFKAASILTSSATSGKKLFDQLVVLKSIVYKTANTDDEVSTEVVNNIQIALETRRKTYYQDFRYISGPTLPTEKDRKSPLVVILGAGAIGLFLMMFVSLIVSWGPSSFRVELDKSK